MSTIETMHGAVARMDLARPETAERESERTRAAVELVRFTAAVLARAEGVRHAVRLMKVT